MDGNEASLRCVLSLFPDERWQLCHQLRVFRPGLPVNGNVPISVFPQHEEVVIGLACGYLIAHHDLHPAKLEMRERAGNEIHRCA